MLSQLGPAAGKVKIVYHIDIDDVLFMAAVEIISQQAHQAGQIKIPGCNLLIAHRVQKDCILYLASNGHAIDIVCVNEKVT